MMKLAFTSLFSLLSFLICSAQVNDNVSIEKSINLNFGINQLKEENLHQKVHSGSLIGVEFEREISMRDLRILNLSVHYSRPKTNFESLAASLNANFHIAYSYLFRLADINANLSYFAGPNINVDYQLNFYPNWDESHIYWSNCAGIGFRNLLKYDLSDKKQFVIGAGINLIDLLSRPSATRDYKIDNTEFTAIINKLHSNGQLSTLNSLIKFNFNFEYKIKISQTYQQSIVYAFQYKSSKTDVSERFQLSVNSIGLKIYL